MNNISIVGRITKDVELSKTTSGLEFTRFNVAVQSEFKNEDGERLADYFRCVAWRDNAKNIAKYFKKGYPIGIVGSMNCRRYEKANGDTDSIWEVNVKNFYFVGSTNEEKEVSNNSKKNELEPIDDDNLPF